MSTKVNNEKIVSKNFMFVIASLLTMLGICYGFVYFAFVNNDINNEDNKNDNEIKKCTGTFDYVVDYNYNIIEIYNIDDVKATTFYSNFNVNNLKEIAKKDIQYYDYTLNVCDVKIYFFDDSQIVEYKDKYYELGSNEKYVIEFTNEVLDTIQEVSFYSLNPKVLKFDLNNKEQAVIIKNFDNLDYSEKNIDLFIEGKYLLSVGNKKIYFDDFSGYALYKDEIVKIDNEILKLLSNYGAIKNEECCSCCPDLKPGESCIALCCPCGS